MVRRLTYTLVVCLGWLACVGDEPKADGADATTGERRGPCFPDGKCKEGLECLPAEDICVVPGEVLDGGGDTTRADGAAEAGATDASPIRCELSAEAGVRCPTAACTGVTSCCITPVGAHTCATSCLEGARHYECDSKSACGAGTRCCAAVASEAPAVACTRRALLTFSYCESYICQGSTQPTCRTAADCVAPDNACILTEVELVSGVVAVWGFCGKN